MTDKDREKWDAKYLRKPANPEPSRILQKYWDLAPRGNALDIACGQGRNSIFLAQKGFSVDAVDISTVATQHLAETHPEINVNCQDLDAWTMAQNRYELIVNVRFLDRRLFPMISAGLRPGGVLIFESFMEGKRDAYCLQPNELLQAFRSLRVIFYEEKRPARDGGGGDRIASMVAINAPLTG